MFARKTFPKRDNLGNVIIRHIDIIPLYWYNNIKKLNLSFRCIQLKKPNNLVNG